MVTICEGRRSEKDSAINSFIQETVGQIRSTLFFFFGQNQVNIFFFFGQIRLTWQKLFSHNMLLCNVQSILIFSDNHIDGASAQYLYLFRCHDDGPADHSDRWKTQMTVKCTRHLHSRCIWVIFELYLYLYLYLCCICILFVFGLCLHFNLFV